MSVSYLLIPLFFIALIVYVAWPLMNEAEAPTVPPPARQRPKRK